MAKTSLYRRLVSAFTVFALVFSLVFGLLVWSVAHMAEDRLVARFLELELADYLERRVSDPRTPLPSGRHLVSSFEAISLPLPGRGLADADDGVHEITSLLDGEEAHLLIHTLDGGRRLYLYLKADQMEVLDESQWWMTWTLISGVVLVTLLGIVLGRSTARRVIAPVVDLARRVQRHDPEQPADFASDLADDEVGFLGRSLEESMARSRAFLERERRFTRDASHELRSPVTVIRGAVELLEALPEAEKPAIRRPVERIRRAGDDMGRLIEAFLWLSREEALAEGAAPRLLAAEVLEAVERYRHLIEGKEVGVEVAVAPEATVEAPEGILGIVLGNLVANAFHFTRRGTVRIHGDGRHLEVSDSGPGIAEARLASIRDAHQRGSQSQGFGLGLAIVTDLCERFGWRFELESREGEGTRAAIEF